MAKIYYIGENTYTEKYKYSSSFSEFIIWLKAQKVLGHDTETNVVPSILDRELRAAQFGDLQGEILYIIQWSFLTEEQKKILTQTLSNTNAKILTYTTFEYNIWRKYGLRLKNIWDCYSVEKILNTGYTVEKGFYSLAGTLKRRFDMDISKAMQCEFSDNIFTDQKIEYAAIDVYKLGKLFEIQKRELKILDKRIQHKIRFSETGKKFSEITYYKGATKTAWWENEFTKVLGDMEFEGMQHDRKVWIDNYNLAQPIVENATKELNKVILNSIAKEFLIKNSLYTDVDIFDSIWTSANKKLKVLSWVFDGVTGTSKVALKEYLRDNDPDFPKGLKTSGKAWENSTYKNDFSTDYAVIKLIIARSKEDQEGIDKSLNSFLKTNLEEKLLEEKLLIPANTMTINWNSHVQRLLIFQSINQKITDTTAQTVEDNMLNHELFKIYRSFADANALITKFGLNYLDHVEADGRIRTRFDPILATGRISAFKPNLLQLPSLQRYRDAFIATPGWKIIGADYSSEEILIIALLAKDPVWLKSFRNGDDVHSVNASLIYGDDWTVATEPGCEFEKKRQKCSCKGHITMRKASKSVSFGISYGLSAYGAAVQLHLTREEAQALIDKFFNTFPSIRDKLDSFGRFGYKKGFITEPVLGRVRFYDKWKIALIKKLDSGQDLTYPETKEAEKHKSSIIRASKNCPIQGAGAGVLKISGVLLRRYILNNNLQNVMRLLLPPHDEWVMEAKIGYEKLAAEKLTYYMELAGKLALKTDLLKAESYIDNHWVK